MKKRWISGLILAVLLMGMLVPTAAAQQTGKLIVSDAAGKVGETIQVDVSIADNPGVIALAMKVHYDAEMLELIAVDNKEMFPDSMFSQSYASNPYYASWSDALATRNNGRNGVLMTLTFRILDMQADGNTQVSLSVDPGDMLDWELETQPFTTVGGTVTIHSDTEEEIEDTNKEPEDSKEESKTETGTKSEMGAVSSTYSRFVDLKADGWYRNYVEYMLDHGYMNGITTTSFAPDGKVTRAQLVTILYRMEGEPSVRGMNNPFADVPDGTWYSDAVIWAADRGVITGTTKSTFAPNNNITREQLATVLYRYGSANADLMDHLSQFTDQQTISAYARSSMNWAVGAGIMNGSDAKLNPSASATRVQTAAVLVRFVEARDTAIPLPTDPTLQKG